MRRTDVQPAQQKGRIMKTRKVIANLGFVAAVLTLVLGVALSAQSQTVLIKMGDNQTFNGTNAPSPDINGHYWNSVDSSQFFPYLTYIDGTLAQWAVFGFEVGEQDFACEVIGKEWFQFILNEFNPGCINFSFEFHRRLSFWARRCREIFIYDLNSAFALLFIER